LYPRAPLNRGGEWPESPGVKGRREEENEMVEGMTEGRG